MSDVTLQDVKDFCVALDLKFNRWDQENEPEKFWILVIPDWPAWSEASSSVQIEKVRQWKRGEIRALTYLKCDKVKANMLLPAGWTNEQVIELDAFLRRCGILCEEQEIATTDFLPQERKES